MNIRKAQLLNKTGSGSAILISALASASILGMIVVSQQSISNFINEKNISVEQWQLDLISRHALTLGGYLISHNLVLCREGGWKNEPNKIPCTWNDEADTPSEDFQLTRTRDDDSSQQGSKQLSFIGTITIGENIAGHETSETDDSGGPRTYKYKLNFDLLKWKDSELEPLVGQIPNAICRNKQTLEVIQNGSCENIDTNNDGSPDANHEIIKTLLAVKKDNEDNKKNQAPSIQCRDENNRLIQNSSCEFISMVDQDHHIVVMTVKAPFEEDTVNPNAQVLRSGVRRPLAQISIEVTQQPQCPLQCATPRGANSFTGCRGSSTPTGTEEYTSAKLELEVTNNGPGAIYALSLFKTFHLLDGHESEEAQKAVEQSLKVTENILGGDEVLLPGQSKKFEDLVPCLTETNVIVEKSVSEEPEPPPPNPQTGEVELVRQETTQVEASIDIHSQEFMNVEYDLAYLQSESYFSACVKDDQILDEGNNPCPEIVQDPTLQQAKTTTPSYLNDHPCGKDKTGTCYYPHIEPRRLFRPIRSEPASGGVMRMSTVKQKVSIVVKYVPPH